MRLTILSLDFLSSFANSRISNLLLASSILSISIWTGSGSLLALYSGLSWCHFGALSDLGDIVLHPSSCHHCRAFSGFLGTHLQALSTISNLSSAVIFLLGV